jgi:hypothetical protein
MTNKSAEILKVPFIFGYAEPLENIPTQILRYDKERQLSQVLVGDDWVNTIDARVDPSATTRLTRVRPETSDEE